MAIVGTDEEENNPNGMPTSSSSPNAHAASAAAQGVPYDSQNGSGGFVGGSGTGSGQGATTGVGATAAPAKGGGGYTNLSQYLAANQGSGATTGQGAENVVQQSADAAQTSANQFNTGATNDIKNATAGLGVNQKTEQNIAAGTPAYDPAEAALIKNGGYSFNPNKDWQQALKDPTSASEDTLKQIVAEGGKANTNYTGPSNFSTAQYNTTAGQYTPVSYQGPQSLTGFSGNTATAQQNAVTNQGVLQGNVQNANGGQTGVSALLRSAYQQPNYTKGENSLDAFLVNGTPGGQQALGQATGVGQKVNDSYQSLLGNLQNQITAGQKQADTTNATYGRDVENAQNTANNNIQKYQTDVADTKARAVRGTDLAHAAAKKAQGELDSRQTQLAAQQGQQVQAPPSLGGKISDYLKTAGGNIANTAKQEGNNIAGFAKNPLGTTVKEANTIGGQVASAGKVAGGQIADATKSAINNPYQTALQATGIPSGLTNKIKVPGFAHGGQVPSYSKLSKMLRRK